MNKCIKILGLMTLLLALMAGGLQAATYVSLNGEFYITYPDDWEQIDFNTVDLFLRRSSAEPFMFDYDAVLAPSASSPFFSGDYVILTVDKSGKLTSAQIDSVLEILSSTFTAGITYTSSENLTADIESDVPRYDRERKIVSVLNDIYQGQEAVKKNLMLMRFYDKGIATFYCYSTDSLFESSRQVFENMVASLSSENIEQIIPREQVKVADIKVDAEGRVKRDKSWTMLYLAIAVFVLLVLAAVFMKFRKKQS